VWRGRGGKKMNCEKCNRFINEAIEEAEEVSINNKWVILCPQCFDEYWNEYLKENRG